MSLQGGFTTRNNLRLSFIASEGAIYRARLHDLLADGEGDLSDEQATNLTELRDQLDQLLATAADCPGDGNDDLVVDQTDLDEWAYWADTEAGRGLSSWYDLNHDGLTDAADRAIIEAHMGGNCR